MKVALGFLLGIVLGVGSTYTYFDAQSDSKKDATLSFPEIVIGHESAPVDVMEYSSVGCGICGEFKKSIWPKIKGRYVDGGDVRWTLRSFPLSQPDLKAAMLAHCHPDPHHLMEIYYLTQDRWLMAKDPVEELKKIALEEGMTEDDIEKCWANEGLLDGLIGNRMHASQKYQLVGTPSFIVGGTIIPGYIPFDKFSELLDKALVHVRHGMDLEDFVLKEEEVG